MPEPEGVLRRDTLHASVEGLDHLTLRIVPTFIRDQDGKFVDEVR